MASRDAGGPLARRTLRERGRQLPGDLCELGRRDEILRRLTEQERTAGRLPAGSEYNLPTEAQWEYACRAETQTPYNFGKAPSELPQNAWFMKNAGGDGEEYAHPVGGKNANRWGLHDMHGNVSEWCRDWYAKDLPGGTDPEATAGASTRVLRGGGWRSTADDCRSAFRNGANPTNRNPAWGFRIALVKTRDVKPPSPRTAVRGRLRPSSNPNIRRAIAPREADLVRSHRPARLFPEIDQEIGVKRQPPIGVAVQLQQDRALFGDVGIELIVPRAVERVGDVQAFAVEADL